MSSDRAKPAVLDPEFLLADGEHAGFLWRAMHNGNGFRCGYVRIPEGHPWHRVHPRLIPAECHGGLNWSGRDGGYWWVGFDCAHAWDRPDLSLPMADEVRSFWEGVDRSSADRPGMSRAMRSQEYVEAHCRGLCEQAREAAGGDRT